jgi:uncharacterized membrane protein
MSTINNMPVAQKYQIDYFAIVVLLATVLIIAFLIVSAIYFSDLVNLKPPTKTESSFLFWTSIILSVIFFAIMIYAMWRIFTYTVLVWDEPISAGSPKMALTQTSSVVVVPQVVAAQPIAVVKTTTPAPLPILAMPAPTPVRQRTALEDELAAVRAGLT